MAGKEGDARKPPKASSERSAVLESEDEGVDEYRRGGYHAVRIGDWFSNGRYVVHRKLGWGHFSTVWLAWDAHDKKYVALKVQKSAQQYTEAAQDEIEILKQIAEKDPHDRGGVVKLVDHFEHRGPNGTHVCMVFEYLGDNLLTLIKAYNYRGIPLRMVKQLAKGILIGLDYLHQLSIIHTDLKPENVLLLFPLDPSKDPRNPENVPLEFPSPGEMPRTPVSVEKQSMLSPNLSKNQKKKAKRRANKAGGNGNDRDRQDANSDARAPKVEPDANRERPSGTGDDVPKSGRSSSLCEDLERMDLRCKIVDLGNACWTFQQFTADIQTRQYRCPEVLLGSQYSTPADMWSFACIVFELATGDVLFDPRRGVNFDTNEDHLALMMELLGSMPEVASSGKHYQRYFTGNGKLRNIRMLRGWPLREVLVEKYKYGEQDAKEFADFLVPLLDFVPKNRPTAAKCLSHSWVTSLSGSKESAEEEKTCDAVQEGLRNIALVGGGLVESTPNGNVKSTNKPTTNKLVRNEDYEPLSMQMKRALNLSFAEMEEFVLVGDADDENRLHEKVSADLSPDAKHLGVTTECY